MKPAAFLELAEQVGVSFCLGSAGRIKAKGEAEQINRLAPLIREHKAELLAYLQSESGQRHELPLPFLDDLGRLRIPLDADDKTGIGQVGSRSLKPCWSWERRAGRLRRI
ncbi:MAG: hypothetical protein ACL93V_07100 [Candidatus Electrothrix sp. YB6]